MKTRKHKIKKQDYGIGGAIMTLGKNLLQGKKLGSGALKGVLRAGITPGSGIGAGIGLAGAGLAKIGEKTGRQGMQKLGKGLGMAGGLAGMFTGGSTPIGFTNPSQLAGAGKFGSMFTRGGAGGGGIDTFLHGAGKQVQGGVLPFLAQRFMGEEGMKVPYAYGGKMKVMKKGGLVGGQKKLDKNNDGKITGEDFKMLRSMMGGGKMEYMDGGKMYENGGEVDSEKTGEAAVSGIASLLGSKMGSMKTNPSKLPGFKDSPGKKMSQEQIEEIKNFLFKAFIENQE